MKTIYFFIMVFAIACTGIMAQQTDVLHSSSVQLSISGAIPPSRIYVSESEGSVEVENDFPVSGVPGIAPSVVPGNEKGAPVSEPMSDQIDQSDVASYSSQQYWVISSFPESEINQGWDAHKMITDFNYGNGKWILVMSGGSGYTYQQYSTHTSFPTSSISQGWNEGKSITKLFYGGGYWVLVMTKGTSFTSQYYCTRSSYPSAEIKEQWDLGRKITSLTYCNNVWVLVMSGYSKYTNQSWWTRSSFPSAEIKSGWDAGKHMTTFVHGNGVYALVMSKVSSYSAQLYYSNSSFPSAKINEGWDLGLDITSLCYGNGTWLLVMTKMFNINTPELKMDEIALYPNPVSSSFSLKGIGSEAGLEIFNVNGTTMRKFNYSNGPIDISSFDPGIYFLRIRMDGQNPCTRRIVKL